MRTCNSVRKINEEEAAGCPCAGDNYHRRSRGSLRSHLCKAQHMAGRYPTFKQRNPRHRTIHYGQHVARGMGNQHAKWPPVHPLRLHEKRHRRVLLGYRHQRNIHKHHTRNPTRVLHRHLRHADSHIERDRVDSVSRRTQTRLRRAEPFLMQNDVVWLESTGSSSGFRVWIDCSMWICKSMKSSHQKNVIIRFKTLAKKSLKQLVAILAFGLKTLMWSANECDKGRR